MPREGYGGIELVVSLLADGLQERGHSVSLFAAEVYGCSPGCLLVSLAVSVALTLA